MSSEYEQMSAETISAVTIVLKQALTDANGAGYDIPEDMLENPAMFDDYLIRMVGGVLGELSAGGL